MSTYLRRLKSMLAENIPAPLTDRIDRSSLAPPETGTAATDKTDRSSFVSSVSDVGGHFSRGTPGTVGTPNGSCSDIPTEWAEAIEHLLCRPCPEAESAERWACACLGLEQFARDWAGSAVSLGWTFDELFAFAEPFANGSLQGAAWFVGGSTVTAVTADAITLRTERGATQRIYRKPRA